MITENQWRRCSACKKPIEFSSTYWVCNVSTCNGKRTGLVFCSVSCWEVHLPGAKHRKAWAAERTAPPQAMEVGQPVVGPRRIMVGADKPTSQEKSAGEVLIIASRLKAYIQKESGFNTSERVLDPLSDIVRRLCDEAIQNASREGRRTVLDRDIPLE